MNRKLEKIHEFHALHAPGKPLVLVNAWDAGSAQVVEAQGAAAIASSSYAMAAAQGFPDGERMPLRAFYSTISQIVRSVNVPVTVDFEGGYARELHSLASNMEHLLDIGVCGINLEDKVQEVAGMLPPEEQGRRIETVVGVAMKAGVPVFVNARTDVFLQARDEDSASVLLSHVLDRARVYADAGADGLFVPGLSDLRTIRALCERSPLPVNIMLGETGPAPAALVQAGVARLSLGPGPYLRAMETLRRQAAAMFASAQGSPVPERLS